MLARLALLLLFYRLENWVQRGSVTAPRSILRLTNHCPTLSFSLFLGDTAAKKPLQCLETLRARSPFHPFGPPPSAPHGKDIAGDSEVLHRVGGG